MMSALDISSSGCYSHATCSRMFRATVEVWSDFPAWSEKFRLPEE